MSPPERHQYETIKNKASMSDTITNDTLKSNRKRETIIRTVHNT